MFGNLKDLIERIGAGAAATAAAPATPAFLAPADQAPAGRSAFVPFVGLPEQDKKPERTAFQQPATLNEILKTPEFKGNAEPKAADQKPSGTVPGLDAMQSRGGTEDIKQLYMRPLQDMKTKAEAKQPEIARATHELSWDEYDNLSPQQRAAVDYNTMLTKAAAADRGLGNMKPTDAQSKAYRDEYSNVLGGQDGVTESYAPNTVALLNQIGYRNPKTSALAEFIAPQVADHTTIDDFLDLKQAITDADLKHYLGDGAKPVDITDSRGTFVQGMANSTQSLAEKLAKGNQLLSTFSGSADTARAADLTRLGLTPTVTPETQPGFGTDAMSKNFAEAFDYLSQVKDKPTFDQVTGAFVKNLRDQKIDPDLFYTYAATRLANAANYGAPDKTDATKDRNLDGLSDWLELHRKGS